MAAFTTLLAIGSLATTAYSVSEQSKAAKKSASAQRDASAAQGRASAVEAQQARTQQIREARIRRGQVVSAAEGSGLGTGTSGIGGAVGSISSQMGQNIGTINQQQTFATETSVALQKSADAQVDQQKWQQIGNFSQSIFSQAGGMTTIFGGNTHKGVK